MPEQVKKTLVLSIYFALAVSTFLVFWQVRNLDFINYDDPSYVTENPHVLNGLTADSAWWAFTTFHTGYWHALTWLSYMLDRQFFGPNPAGFHLTNLFFHIANTLLLFLVLKQMTKAIWQSAFVAALFALHPMHVESVAWIAERKDVLSTFFWMLTLLAYFVYVSRPSVFRYIAILAAFALGLMAKPMLVTLPFVLLLLDYWPLDRISRFQWKIFYRLILEKIPFIVLSVVFSVMTFIAQRNGGVVIEFTNLGMKYRIYNAFISYIIYIGKLFRPSHLAVFYPHPVENVPILYAVISAAALLAVTIFVIRFAQNRRYLVTGWFWYLGTLVPVIGIIQVGSQAYADRYTYIPYIGLFIMLAWGLPQLLSKLPQRKIALGVSIVIVLTTLGICAHRQTSYWKNSITLFSHANQVTQNNYLAYYDLGVSYGKLGRITEAIEAYKNAVRIKPAYVEAYYNLGNACSALGRYTEAIEVYKQAIRIQPDLIDAHNNLGIAYCALGRWPEAIEAYNQAIRIQPDDPGAHYNLGNAYCAIGRWSEAIEAYKNAIRIKPDLAEAHTNLGIVYRKLGRFTEAIDAYKQAIKIKPNFAEAYANLGIAYLAIGDKNSAMAEYNILKSLNSEMASKLLNQINK